MKISITILIILILLVIVFAEGIGNYFVDYALARSGNGGDRQINEESKIDVLGEDETIIEENRLKDIVEGKEWANNSIKENASVQAEDGITLKGIKYISNEQTDNWAIVCHGYRADSDSVLGIGKHFADKNYNVLIPDMRACGDSEGEYLGMGWLDKDDLEKWANLIIEENPNANIIFHGSSMGAATVLMSSGDKLPSNVKAIIADSGYTSVWDIFASEAKARFSLPEFPILNIFQIVANRRAKYDIKEASAVEQVKKSITPILFIHGDKDDFVPEYMCETLYEAATCKKQKLIIQGAGHTDGKYRQPELYYNTMFEFIEQDEF